MEKNNTTMEIDAVIEKKKVKILQVSDSEKLTLHSLLGFLKILVEGYWSLP